MNALFLYGLNAGDDKVIKNFDYILSELKSSYDEVNAILCKTKEEFVKNILEMDIRDDLIFAGGDGTFNLVVNTLAKLDRVPTIGYLPTGTLNDVARCLQIPTSLKGALKVIKLRRKHNIDVVKTNEGYFAYMLAIGQYSDIAYRAKRGNKRQLGRFCYYNIAFKEAFHKKEIELELNVNGKKQIIKTNFLMILNGTHVAGFSVNKNCKMYDGAFEIFWAEKGAFNGLLHYISKKKLHVLKAHTAEITVKGEQSWCFDGEEVKATKLNIECLRGFLKIYTSKNPAYLEHFFNNPLKVHYF